MWLQDKIIFLGKVFFEHQLLQNQVYICNYQHAWVLSLHKVRVTEELFNSVKVVPKTNWPATLVLLRIITLNTSTLLLLVCLLPRLAFA